MYVNTISITFRIIKRFKVLFSLSPVMVMSFIRLSWFDHSLCLKIKSIKFMNETELV